MHKVLKRFRDAVAGVFVTAAWARSHTSTTVSEAYAPPSRPTPEPDDVFYCPRGPGKNTPFNPPFNGEATWQQRNNARRCSFCGSMNGDDLMARIEAGSVVLGPTDKAYKVYVNAAPDTAQLGHSKFYFSHWTAEQQARFIELHNEKRLHVSYPGHFYMTPFFCRHSGH